MHQAAYIQLDLFADAKRERERAYQSAYREKNREKLAVQSRERWVADRERKLAVKRAYYEANREEILRKQREQRETGDPAKRAECNRAYRERNRERIKAKQRAWYRANAEHVKARVLARGNVGGYRGRVLEKTPDTLAYAQVLRCDPCSYCGGKGGSIDHVVPVALGGCGEWGNLTAACRSCNSSKSASPLFLFLTRRMLDG